MNHPLALLTANVGFLALITVANLQGAVAVVAGLSATAFYLVELFEKPSVLRFMKYFYKQKIKPLV